MQGFTPGQRWVNNAELGLGLGTVISVEHRTVTLLFQATGETRTYSKDTAPLTRVAFARGDVIRDQEGRRISVESVRQSADGLLLYSGRDNAGAYADLPETRLDNHIQLNRPKDRLLNGLVDENKWFTLRYLTLLELNRIGHSSLPGLTGCRTDLIPHQLYIAHEISGRHAPRVLLADEVGLGKTIEAGLIMHQQLFTERIQRVLIVVPENLLHQWLVEMLRRFNLRFSIFDEERYRAMIEPGMNLNPFQEEQLVLCTLDLLVKDKECFRHALDAGWDMLVVDEAHHLHWEPGNPGPEYRVIEQLAAVTHGVLLLTATPEQLGKASHYARLRILDPARFPDYGAFLEEERGYEPVARAVDALFAEEWPDTGAIRTVSTLLDLDPEDTRRKFERGLDRKNRSELMAQLLDRHGTGRVLFRNTRAAVKGFPGRRHHPAPLPLPVEYADLKAEDAADLQSLLSLERHFLSSPSSAGKNWTQVDPRMNWLKEKLISLRAEKVLVITSSGRSAADMVDILRLRAGIAAALFHEGMTIIERDRAAAWFADGEAGAQALVCSEIGSEGRNFQFAHHLILFDLPLEPDLLEQRIGRLDRIGQKRTVQIHVPYITGTAQEIMYCWYHEGLEAFNKPCHAGQAVFEREKTSLTAVLRGDGGAEELIAETRELNTAMNEELEKGRDRLLEYNSCPPEVAERLYREAVRGDARSTLPAYMERVFDCFGVHSEEHSSDSLVLAPEAGMITAFPHLPEDGMTVTYSRRVALAHEDRHFLTWSHPMVVAAMDLVLSLDLGNTAVVAIKYPRFSPGKLLLEGIYLLESAAGDVTGRRGILPPALIRVLVGEDGKDHSASIKAEDVEMALSPIDRDTAGKIISLKQDEIKNLMNASNNIAAGRSPEVTGKARAEITAILSGEIARLEALGKVNPNVRGEEIAWFKARLDRVEKAFDAVTPRLDAVRLLVTT